MFRRLYWLIAIFIFVIFSCKPKENSEENSTKSSADSVTCSPEIKLIEKDISVEKEDLIIKNVELNLDIATVNYIDLAFIPEKIDSTSDLVEFIICSENYCLCKDDIFQPTVSCDREQESDLSSFSRSYLFQENIRIPAKFSGIISVKARLCVQQETGNLCGEFIDFDSGVNLVAPENTDESIQGNALLKSGKDMYSLVDNLATELSSQAKKDPKLNSLAFNFTENTDALKALLVHDKGNDTFSTISDSLDQ